MTEIAIFKENNMLASFAFHTIFGFAVVGAIFWFGYKMLDHM